METDSATAEPERPQTIKLCKRCKGEIFWARTARGSVIPLDAVYVLGFVLEGMVGGTPQALQKRIYTTHFATCPNAAEFRKKGRKAPDG